MNHIKLFEEFEFKKLFKTKKLEEKDINNVLNIIEDFSKRHNLDKRVHFENNETITKDILFFKAGIDIRFYTNNLEAISIKVSGFHSWPGNTPNDTAVDIINTLNSLKNLKLKVRGIPKELPSRTFEVRIKP